LKRFLALLACLALVGAACGDDDTSSADSKSQAGKTSGKAKGVDLTVTATDYSFDIPSEIGGGVVTVQFVNKGSAEHELAFLDIRDTPVDKAIADFRPVAGGEGASIPDYLNAYGALEVEPGETVTSTFTLPEGRYLVICSLTDQPGEPTPVEGNEEEGDDGPPHFDHGMYKLVTVKGDNGKKMRRPATARSRRRTGSSPSRR
jgi:plastocyanin